MADSDAKNLAKSVSALEKTGGKLVDVLKKRQTTNTINMTVPADEIIEYINEKIENITSNTFIYNSTTENEAIDELTEAIRLSIEYTGNDVLPAIEGWSWFDALKKYAPEKAQRFVDNPLSFPETKQDPYKTHHCPTCGYIHLPVAPPSSGEIKNTGPGDI